MLLGLLAGSTVIRNESVPKIIIIIIIIIIHFISGSKANKNTASEKTEID